MNDGGGEVDRDDVVVNSGEDDVKARSGNGNGEEYIDGFEDEDEAEDEDEDGAGYVESEDDESGSGDDESDDSKEEETDEGGDDETEDGEDEETEDNKPNEVKGAVGVGKFVKKPNCRMASERSFYDLRERNKRN